MFKEIFTESFNYETIISQMGGRGTLAMMIGAKNYMFDDKEKSLTFKFKGSKKANYVKITLNSKDLYDVKFIKARGSSIKDVGEFKDVQSSELKNIFTSFTELYLNI